MLNHAINCLSLYNRRIYQEKKDKHKEAGQEITNNTKVMTGQKVNNIGMQETDNYNMD